MTIFLTTERLLIKAPSQNDLEDQFKLQSDPEVMRYIGKGVRALAEVETSLQTSIDHYRKHGFSLGSVFEKESENFIGRAGLIYLAFDDTQPAIEVAYALLKPYWGKGYATELAKALIKWGFTHLDIDRLVAVTRPQNEKSRRVLANAGMNFIKMTDYSGIEVVSYEIARENLCGKV